MNRSSMPVASLVTFSVLSIAAAVLVPFWYITLAFSPLPVYLALKGKGLVAAGLVFLAIIAVDGLLLGFVSLAPALVMLTLGYTGGFLSPALRPGRRIMLTSVVLFTIFSLLGVVAFMADRPGATKIWTRESATIEKRLLAQTGDSGVDSTVLEGEITKFISVAPYLFFGMTALGSVWIVGSNYLLTGRLAKARDYEWSDLPKFSTWQMPWYLVYGFILGLIGFLFNESFGVYGFYAFAAGLNLLLVFGALYLIQGISVVFFYLEKKTANTAIKIGVVFLAIFIQLFFQGISWLGVFDTWFDLRRLATTK